jgi:hypothetical protein
MEEVIIETVENVTNAVNRIEGYILSLKQHFLEEDANLDITFYSKMYRNFILIDGSIDKFAISTLSKLCRKKGISLYLEMNCKVFFQETGINREIGVNFDSTLGADHKILLINACLKKNTKNNKELNNENEIVVTTETDMSLKTPKLCSRKPFVEQSQRGQNKIVKNIKNCFNDNFQIKNTNDVDNIALHLLSKTLKRKCNEVINKETTTIQHVDIIPSEEKEKLKKKNNV